MFKWMRAGGFMKIYEPAVGFSWWLAVVAAFAAMWFGMHAFPSGNNVYHLPIVLDYAGSLEGPHDAYHQSFANFTSFFWQGVAVIVTEANIRKVFLALLIVGSMVTVFGAYTIAVVAGAPRGIAAVGAGFLAFAFTGREIMEFGAGELLSSVLTHSQFATAVCLIAIALAVGRRWLWASVLCGCAANINLFLGFWLMGNLLLARFAIGWQSEPRLPWLECAKMAGACLITSAPVIAWALRTIGPSESLEFSFTEFLYQTFPYHSFVHLELWNCLAFVALLAAVWFGAFRNSSEATRRLGMLVITSGATVLIGSLAVYLSDERMIQNLYPLRYAAIAHWLAAVGVIVLWGNAEKIGSDRAVFGAISILGFALRTPAVTMLGLVFLMDNGATESRLRWVVLLGLAVSLIVPAFSTGAFSTGHVDLPKSPWLGPLPAITVICVVGAVLLSVCRHRFGTSHWPSIVLLWLTASTTLVPEKVFAAVFALTVVTMAAMMLRGVDRRVIAAFGTGGAMAMVAYVILRSDLDKTVLGSMALALTAAFFGARVAAFRGHWNSSWIVGACLLLLSLAGFARGAKQGFDFPTYPKAQNWFEAQKWARQNTPPDTLFYAPGRFDFAILSRRPLWWDANEFAAVMWSPSFYEEWNTRRILAETVQTSDELVSLARKEKIRFIVLEKKQIETDPHAGLDVRYCNVDFCIAEVN